MRKAPPVFPHFGNTGFLFFIFRIMAKNTEKEVEEIPKQTYSFPELGVSVEATSLEEAQKLVSKI